MGDVREIELIPGLTVCVDEDVWNVNGGLSLALLGDDHEVFVDLRIRTVETGEVSKVENVLYVRTA